MEAAIPALPAVAPYLVAVEALFLPSQPVVVVSIVGVPILHQIPVVFSALAKVTPLSLLALALFFAGVVVTTHSLHVMAVLSVAVVVAE